MPHGDEATWDSRRSAGAPAAPQPPGPLATVPPEVRDLLAACVDLDPAARPRLVDVRAVLSGLVDDPPPFG